MTICNSRLGLWAWRDIICIWTTMKTRTPDLLSMMSYACANMAHCPSSMPMTSDNTHLSTVSTKKILIFWVLPWEKILKILQVAKDKCKLCPVPTRKACWSHPQIAIWNCFANTQAVLLQTHRTLQVSEFHWRIFCPNKILICSSSPLNGREGKICVSRKQ